MWWRSVYKGHTRCIWSIWSVLRTIWSDSVYSYDQWDQGLSMYVTWMFLYDLFDLHTLYSMIHMIFNVLVCTHDRLDLYDQNLYPYRIRSSWSRWLVWFDLYTHDWLDLCDQDLYTSDKHDLCDLYVLYELYSMICMICIVWPDLGLCDLYYLWTLMIYMIYSIYTLFIIWPIRSVMYSLYT